MKYPLLLIAIILLPLVVSAGEPEKFIYKTVGDEELELYIIHSEKTDAPSAAVVWFYGSGLRKKEPGQFYEHGKILAKMGMTSIHTNIRGAVEGEERNEGIAIRCIEDAKSAF